VVLPAAEAGQTTPCCLATRKLVARALRTGAAGIAVYNLVNNDVVAAPLPQGVTSIGQPVAAAQGGGQTPGGGQGPGGGQIPGGQIPGGQIPGGQIPGGQLPGAGGEGGAPAVATVQGGLVSANVRANTVAAVAYNGARQVGIIVIRVP
jgi:hypothetical protein